MLSTRGVWIQSLAGELRSHKAHGMASRQKQNENLNTLGNYWSPPPCFTDEGNEVWAGEGPYSQLVSGWIFSGSRRRLEVLVLTSALLLSSLCILFVGFLSQLVPLTRSWWAAGMHWTSSVCYYVEGGNGAEGCGGSVTWSTQDEQAEAEGRQHTASFIEKALRWKQVSRTKQCINDAVDRHSAISSISHHTPVWWSLARGQLEGHHFTAD